MAIHPTTLAIIAGLRGEAPTGSVLEQELALEVHRLIAETRLSDADEIAKVGLAGWDLGFRHEGTRYEITARYRDDSGHEMLVTALIDRRKTNGWSYSWIVHRGNPKPFPKQLCPNGVEKSFVEAVALARIRLT